MGPLIGWTWLRKEFQSLRLYELETLKLKSKESKEWKKKNRMKYAKTGTAIKDVT